MKKNENNTPPSGSYHVLMKAAVIIIALCGAAICTFWIPQAAYGGITESASIPVDELWGRAGAVMAFDYTAALPCFAILFLLWKISDLLEDGKLFCRRTARHMRRCAVLLFCDLIYFLIGNVVFYLLGMNDWLYVYLFFIICGCAIAMLFFILSVCLGEAAKLQEESDATI